MAFWVAVSNQNRQDEQYGNEKLDHNHVHQPRNSVLENCIRCGSRFDVAMTEDPEFELCQVCMNYLKNHPEDPYFQERGEA